MAILLDESYVRGVPNCGGERKGNRYRSFKGLERSAVSPFRSTDSGLPLSPFVLGKGSGARVCLAQCRSNGRNDRCQIFPNQCVRQTQHADPLPSEIVVAESVVSLLLAMRASIDLHG